VSRFSNSLVNALDELGWSQLEFAGRCKINRSAVNKYVRGKLQVGSGTLDTMARELPERQRAEVVAAWLRDALPQTSSGLISISTAERVAEQPDFSLGELSPQLDQAVRYLLEKARKHTEISDLLIDLEKALRGQK
jgi:transcriptional regulator with XRE-family HTH domain